MIWTTISLVALAIILGLNFATVLLVYRMDGEL